MSQRVLIVGAGPGGLATALLLAKAGLEVTVVERQPRVGGRTSVIEGDGYRFDLGPTFFLYPQILEEIFTAVGRDLHREVPMKRLDPHNRLVFGAGAELLCTSDIERMVAEIAKLAPTDAPGFRQFMADNRVKLAKFAPCLQSPFPGWTSLLRRACSRRCPSSSPGSHCTPSWPVTSAILACNWRSLFSPSTSACRRSSARASSRSSPSSNTNMVCGIRSAAATRSARAWLAWPPSWASPSGSTNRSRKSSSTDAARSVCGPPRANCARTPWS